MSDGGSLAIDIRPVAFDAPVLNDLESLKSGDYVEIAVSDTGTGMDAETLSKAFNPFFTTKDPDKGTGLGLAISRTIVEESDGQLILESTPDQGTRATVVLPIAEIVRV